MDLFTAPIYALYSVRFYRQVIQSSLSKGFAYLALWSFFVSIVVSMFILLRFFPEANHFMEWFRQDMPTLEWSPEGMTMDKPSPYEMKHPTYGSIMKFDMNKAEVPAAEMDHLFAYVTAKKLYVKQSSRGEIRIYDLIAKDGQGRKESFKITPDVVKELEKKIKPLLLLGIAAMTFLLFFIWKLLAALFYSAIGMLINLFRTPRLSYENVLNVSFFAITGSVWINIIQMFVAGWARINFGFWGSLVMTTTYLYLGIKFTEAEPPPPVIEL